MKCGYLDFDDFHDPVTVKIRLRVLTLFHNFEVHNYYKSVHNNLTSAQ